MDLIQSYRCPGGAIILISQQGLTGDLTWSPQWSLPGSFQTRWEDETRARVYQNWPDLPLAEGLAASSPRQGLSAEGPWREHSLRRRKWGGLSRGHGIFTRVVRVNLALSNLWTGPEQGALSTLSSCSLVRNLEMSSGALSWDSIQLSQAGDPDSGRIVRLR